MTTKTAKHTPGPWTVFDSANENHMISGTGEYGRHLATVLVGDRGGATNDANARLIAAAPDLLAAANRLIDALDGGCSLYHVRDDLAPIFRAAIAKAEGGAA